MNTLTDIGGVDMLTPEIDDCDYYQTSGDFTYHCKICHKRLVALFMWNTTRGFDRVVCEKVFSIPIRLTIGKYKIPNCVPICLDCVKKYGLYQHPQWR